jgi:hypothetical protein
MRKAMVMCLVVYAAAIVAAQPYAYDARIGFGMAVPPSWQRLTRPPHGYPINNFLFGWQRTVDKARAVLVITTLPIVFEGTQPGAKQPSVDLGWLEATFRDYFTVDQGAVVTGVSKITLAGKPAVALEAVGVGNGIAINPRIGQERTKVLVCATLLSPNVALRVQYGAPEWLFGILAPEVRAALGTAHFGAPLATPPTVATIVPNEALREAVQKLAVQPLPAPAIAVFPASGVAEAAAPEMPYKEQSLLAPEQWQALEALARAKGISVGVLLRQIVDEYIQKHAQPSGEEKGAEQKENEKGKE